MHLICLFFVPKKKKLHLKNQILKSSESKEQIKFSFYDY